MNSLQVEPLIPSGKIAFTSPIGAAILDKREGDTVMVETPRGTTRYHIISVHY